MLAKRAIQMMPRAVRSSIAGMSRKARERVGVFSSLLACALEVFLFYVVGFTRPLSIVALSIAGIAALLSAWQTDWSRRPSSVLGACLGSTALNSPFLLALSCYVIYKGADVVALVFSCIGIAVSLPAVLAGLCCLSAFRVARKTSSPKKAARKAQVAAVIGSPLIEGRPQWQHVRRSWKAVEMIEGDPSLVVVCLGGDGQGAAGKKTMLKSLSQRGYSEEEMEQLSSHILVEDAGEGMEGSWPALAGTLRQIGFDYSDVRFAVVDADYRMTRCLSYAKAAGFKRFVPVPVKTQTDTAWVDWNEEFCAWFEKFALAKAGDDVNDAGDDEESAKKSAEDSRSEEGGSRRHR